MSGVFGDDDECGRWLDIGTHCKMATSANNNGVVQLYVDDTVQATRISKAGPTARRRPRVGTGRISTSGQPAAPGLRISRFTVALPQERLKARRSRHQAIEARTGRRWVLTSSTRTMGKTRKQPYRKSRAFDASCRCHGGWPWCEGNRAHADERRKLTADEQLSEYDQLYDTSTSPDPRRGTRPTFMCQITRCLTAPEPFYAKGGTRTPKPCGARS